MRYRAKVTPVVVVLWFFLAFLSSSGSQSQTGSPPGTGKQG
jgi:hypothetical protein